MTDLKDLRYQVIIRGFLPDPTVEDENVDVVVDFENGQHYSATFATIRNIEYLMDRDSKTGECNNGTFFWTLGLIIIRKLERSLILEAVHDLVQSGIRSAFCGPYTLDDGSQIDPVFWETLGGLDP